MAWQILILTAAVFKAGYDILFKRVLNREHTTEALAIVYSASFLLMLPALFFIDLRQDPINLLLLMFRAAIFLTGDILFFKALRHSDLSVVTPFYNLSPVFLIFVSYLALGEVLTAFELIGIALLVAGSFLLKNEATSVKDHHNFFKSKYFYFVITALFMWSVSATMGKYVATSMNAFDMLFIQLFFASAFMILYHSLQYDGVVGLAQGVRKNGSSIVFVALFYIVFCSIYFAVLGMPGTKVSLVVPVMRFSVFIDILLGGALFHEANLVKKVSAAAVMLLGTLVILV